MLSTLAMSLCTRVTDWSFLGALGNVNDLDLSLNFRIEDDAIEVRRPVPKQSSIHHRYLISELFFSDPAANAVLALS